MSSWLLMGLPGVAYMTGIADAVDSNRSGSRHLLKTAFGCKRLRRYSVVCNTITIPDFFSRRYRDEKNILMCISAVTILFSLFHILLPV